MSILNEITINFSKGVIVGLVYTIYCELYTNPFIRLWYLFDSHALLFAFQK